MPYSDNRPDWGENPQTKERLDKVTRLLCGLCSRIDELGGYSRLINETKELSIWWEEHQKEDKERIAREKEVERQKREKKTALGKLTEREKKLLGIH